MVTRVTTHLHVVPKADVDRMFEELHDDASLNIPPKVFARLRGIVYCNTFLADRTITHEDDAAGGVATRDVRASARKSTRTKK